MSGRMAPQLEAAARRQGVARDQAGHLEGPAERLEHALSDRPVQATDEGGVDQGRLGEGTAAEPELDSRPARDHLWHEPPAFQEPLEGCEGILRRAGVAASRGLGDEPTRRPAYLDRITAAGEHPEEQLG